MSESPATFVRRCEALLAPGEPRISLYRTAGGGPARWVRHRAYIIRDASGMAVRMIGAITDRSDHKNLEEANRTLRALRPAGDAGPDHRLDRS